MRSGKPFTLSWQAFLTFVASNRINTKEAVEVREMNKAFLLRQKPEVTDRAYNFIVMM